MSLWIETPALMDRVSGERLVEFLDPNWSLNSAEWLSDSTVLLKLRKYPGNHTPSEVAAVVDCSAKAAMIGAVTVESLQQLERYLDQALTP